MQEKRKGRIQRWIGGYLTAVMVFTSVFSQPFVMSSLAAGEDTDARASASDAVKNSRIQVKNQEKEDIQITVLSDNAGYEPGETVCLELYITNNSDQPVEEGVLSYSGKGILEGSAYFEDLSDLYGITEESPESPEEAWDEEAQDKASQNKEAQDEEAPAPDRNEETGQEGSGISEEGSTLEEENAPEEKAEGQLKERAAADEEEIPGQNPAGQGRIDEADADFDEEMDEGENGDSGEDQKRLTDLTIEPGQSYYVNFYYTIDEEIQGAKSQKIDFNFKGKKEDKRISVKETFRYAIGALNLLPVGLYSEGYEDGQIPAGKEGEIYLTFDLGELKEILEETRGEEEADKEEAGKGEAASPSDKETASPSNGKKASPSKAWVKWEDEGSGAPVKKDGKPLISKLSCQVEAYGVHLENFQTLDLESSEDDMRVTGKFRIAEDTEPGIYFGKAAASYKYRGKNFQTSQGFMVKVLEQEEEEEAGPIQLTGRLEGQDIEVTVIGPRESFPETEELEVRVSELSQEQQEQVARALEKKAEEEGVEIPYYKALDITLYAHGEEIEPIGPVEVSFKNLKLEKQEEKDQQDADAGIALLSSEGEEKAEAYSITELREMESQGTFKIYHLDEADGETVNEMVSSTEEDGTVVMETDHFSAFVSTMTRAAAQVSSNGIEIVPGVDAKGVKITMFNYDSGVNDVTWPLASKGFHFFQGTYSTGAGQGDAEKQGTVDGTGTSNSITLTMSESLKDGYPYVENAGSMDYLFNHTYQKGETMDGGGGLFQQDQDGYYHFSSAENAAYFNQNSSAFTLYKCIIRPKYHLSTKTGTAAQNFLPFNKIDENGLITLDNGDNDPPSAYLNNPVDLWFGMKMEFEFYMPKDGKISDKDMIFDFHGDDDVFVYIDDKLVLDIGGTHGAQSGTINFATGEVNSPRQTEDLSELFPDSVKNGKTFGDYTKHTLKFFYMERGGNISYCSLRFNIPALPDKSLTVGKELTADSVSDASIQNNISYQFRVVKPDKEGKPTEELFISRESRNEGKYDILNASEIKTGEGQVDENGYFTLKAGEKAQFTGFLRDDEYADSPKYIVQEIISGTRKGQYNGIEYHVNEDKGTITNTETDVSKDFIGSTGLIPSGDPQLVIFRNRVNVNKLGTLKIIKEATPGSNFGNEKFKIKVELGDGDKEGSSYAPPDAYWVNGEESLVGTDGYIQLGVGEVAEIRGILSGTTYKITEVDGVTYHVLYKGELTCSEDDKNNPDYAIKIIDGNVNGKFPTAATVDVTITNSQYSVSTDDEISKICEGLEDGNKRTFDFRVEPVEQSADGEWVERELLSGEYPAGTHITVTGKTKAIGKIYFGFGSPVMPGTYYYKVSETKGTDQDIQYDTTFYIYKVIVSADGTAATVEHRYQNGSLVDEKESTEFVNWKTVDLTVKKLVDSKNPSGEFNFTAAVEAKDTNGNAYVFPEPDGSKKYTASGNTVSFKLQHDGSVTIPVPAGAKVTVTEKDAAGYITSYQVGNSSEWTQGSSKVLDPVTSLITVTCKNKPGAVLPDTGGAGVGLIKEYGWMLLLLALLMAGMEVQYYGKMRKKRM